MRRGDGGGDREKPGKVGGKVGDGEKDDWEFQGVVLVRMEWKGQRKESKEKFGKTESGCYRKHRERGLGKRQEEGSRN